MEVLLKTIDMMEEEERKGNNRDVDSTLRLSFWFPNHMVFTITNFYNLHLVLLRHDPVYDFNKIHL